MIEFLQNERPYEAVELSVNQPQSNQFHVKLRLVRPGYLPDGAKARDGVGVKHFSTPAPFFAFVRLVTQTVEDEGKRVLLKGSYYRALHRGEKARCQARRLAKTAPLYPTL